MKAVVEELDSQAFGRTVLKISEPGFADFPDFEAGYLKAHAPFYVYTKVPAEDLALIHHFEEHGFRLAETQLEMTLRLTPAMAKEDPWGFLKYGQLREVGPADDVEPILDLAGRINFPDRIALDPALGPEMSRRRYRAYLEKSWRADNEILFGYHDRRDGRLLGFHSDLIVDEKNVRYLIGGLAEEFRGSPMSPGLGLWLRKVFWEKGFRRVTTHISLSNYPSMEAEYKGGGFRARQTSIVLRKLYLKQAA